MLRCNTVCFFWKQLFASGEDLILKASRKSRYCCPCVTWWQLACAPPRLAVSTADHPPDCSNCARRPINGISGAPAPNPPPAPPPSPSQALADYSRLPEDSFFCVGTSRGDGATRRRSSGGRIKRRRACRASLPRRVGSKRPTSPFFR